MVRNIAEDASIILSLRRSFVNVVECSSGLTPMISTYKRILREKLGTVDQKAAGSERYQYLND
jgi:hypothetical protein